MNNELPSYFVIYVPIITNETYILNHDYALRTGARPAIRTPRIHHVFAESTVLYKLIKLLNSLYWNEPNIMSAIQNGTVFAFMPNKYSYSNTLTLVTF